MRISEPEYRALIGDTPILKQRSKYKNQKVEYNGLVFDSIGERDYYIELSLLERAGEISDLKRQVSIEIQPSFIDSKGKKIRSINYVADFVYYDRRDNLIHYVDYKGYRTEIFKLKKKLLSFKGVEIEEVKR